MQSQLRKSTSNFETRGPNEFCVRRVSGFSNRSCWVLDYSNCGVLFGIVCSFRVIPIVRRYNFHVCCGTGLQSGSAVAFANGAVREHCRVDLHTTLFAFGDAGTASRLHHIAAVSRFVVKSLRGAGCGLIVLYFRLQDLPGVSADVAWSLAGDRITARGTTHRNASTRVLHSHTPRGSSFTQKKQAVTVKHSTNAATKAFATDVAPGYTAMDIDEYEAKLHQVRLNLLPFMFYATNTTAQQQFP
jgi:hypothetical protein